MSFNKIIVLGAGAIGSVYGALLSRKNDVMFIGRKDHVDAINSNGLQISGYVKDKFFVKAETEIRAIFPNTLVLLTTKAQDSAKTVKEIKPLLRRDTVILVLQNGLENEELVKKVIGGEIEVIRGLVALAAEFLEPGKVTFWNGETLIEKSATSEKIVELFNESNLKTRLVDEIEKEAWKKLVVNCAINPLTAIFKVRNNKIGVNSLKGIRHRIIEECISVGRAEGIHFEPNLEELIGKKILGYSNFSSMYQDIMKGKKTEIDFLNGKIVELGKKHRISTPINETLVAMIKFMEEKYEA